MTPSPTNGQPETVFGFVDQVDVSLLRVVRVGVMPETFGLTGDHPLFRLGKRVAICACSSSEVVLVLKKEELRAQLDEADVAMARLIELAHRSNADEVVRLAAKALRPLTPLIDALGASTSSPPHAVPEPVQKSDLGGSTP